MKIEGGSTLSLWEATVQIASNPKLTRNLSCDVAIVGAGLAGITSAYLLTRAGKKVVILDDGPTGGGETGRTTAHLTNEIDDRYYHIEFLHGEEGAKLAAQSQTKAIDLVERIVRDLHIDCNFERLNGYLFVERGESSDELKKELEAAHRSGLTDVELLPSVPSSTFSTGACLRFPNQAQFHPLKYLAALKKFIEENGGKIYNDSHVTEFGTSGGKDDTGIVVKTSEGFSVSARAVIIATNTPVNDWVIMHTKQSAYRTYVVGFELPKGTLEKGLYWDTKDPYHYIRTCSDPEQGQDILIVGGEDHKTGQDDADNQNASTEQFDKLEVWAKARFDALGRSVYEWSGQVMEPVDGLAFLGRNPKEKNTYIITGDSGMGMTNCTAGAMIVSDLILGKENSWSALYDPARKTLKAASEYLKENLNVAAQFVDWVTPGDATMETVKPRHGYIIREGLEKHAVYCDDVGKTHQFSAKCPHLGCVVQWNAVENTWDCPCHGSRFEPLGKVINGPALVGLAPITIASHKG